MFVFGDNSRELRILALSQYADNVIVEVTAVVTVRRKLRSQIEAHLHTQRENLAVSSSDAERKELQEVIDTFKGIEIALRLELQGDDEWEFCVELVRKRRGSVPSVDGESL